MLLLVGGACYAVLRKPKHLDGILNLGFRAPSQLPAQAKLMLTRRQFLALLASGIAADQLLPLCDPSLPWELLAQEVHLRKRETSTNRSYGSGSFGEWITDPNGLPCYHYTCDQVEDPTAMTPVEPAWRAPTDQTHQIGNDRIVAACSNYGYIQIRQDESGPKFLNDYQPEAGLFGAGLGYLTDGNEILGTYYPGNGSSFERFFGMGYLRKQIEGTNFSVDQTIFAPFGDDPVLISEVVVTSRAPDVANLHWAEYWGCRSYPLSWQAFLDGRDDGRDASGQLHPSQVQRLRRDMAAAFDHRVERIPGLPAVLETKLRQTATVTSPETAVQEEMARNTHLPSGAVPSRPSSPDFLPPPTFLASLDDGPVRFLTDAITFFGPSDVLEHTGAAGPDSIPVPAALLRPAGLASFTPAQGIPEDTLPDELAATGAETALILVKPFILQPAESRTLRFIYGYVPKGMVAADLIAKYRANAANAFAENGTAWKQEGIQLAVDADPWVERETRWHSYYLRSGYTFDDFFGEHILSQGQVYQYCFGFQGAARDPLQHALPLIFGESRLAKEVLRYTLKSQQPDGSLPYAITGNGELMACKWLPSDLDLWLLWVASEYVLATRDTAFLDSPIPVWPLKAGGPRLTAREMLARSYHHLVASVGTGRHGLLRGLNDDWNDNIYQQGVPERLRDEVRQYSESVMNAAMATYILDHYARMLRYADDVAGAKEASAFAARQRDAVRAQWAGKWFKRLWFGPAAGWVGEERLWLEPQPWAIVGRCATPEQQKQLVAAMNELLRKPSRIGAKQVGNPPGVKPVDWPGFQPGEAENGGVWAALDGPLIWALAGIDPAMAYDEWMKNSRAHHAEVYRDVWYGIWSGPDVYCSSDSDHAGQTGYDWGLIDNEAAARPSNYRGLSWTAWPVMNMHRHAWPLYSAAKLLGVEFTEQGVDLAPAIPKPKYSFRSKLLGVEKSEKGYQGWYAPQKTGNWTIRVKLTAEEKGLKKLTVNGNSESANAQPDGTIQFSGSSTPDQPLRWSLTRA